MDAILDYTNFFSVITANKLGYFAISWRILKLTTMANALLTFQKIVRV
jgi:hypothetical protein